MKGIAIFIQKKRVIYIIEIFLVIILGLASRRLSHLLPKILGSYAGDTLWGLMVFFVFRFLFINETILSVVLYALTFSFVIEISQLYHAPWIDFIRNTRLGALILGYGFLWSDLLCYSIGITLGVFHDFVKMKIANREV